MQSSEKCDCPLCREEICAPFAIPCRMGLALLEEYSPAEYFDCSRKRSKKATFEAYITPRVLIKGIKLVNNRPLYKYTSCLGIPLFQ